MAAGQTPTAVDMAEQFRRRSEDYEKEGLAAPFKGMIPLPSRWNAPRLSAIRHTPSGCICEFTTLRFLPLD
jgi:hypothetical protein